MFVHRSTGTLVSTAPSTYAQEMSSTGDSRKVGPLRNGVDDIFDMLGVINTTLGQHTAILEQHTAILEQHGTKLDQIIEILER